VTIARELADLVIASALGSQRQALERQRAAFVTAAAGAEADLVTVTRADPLGLDKHTGAVRERVKQARSLVASSTLALKALDEKRAVRFEMVDAGRVPPRVDKTAAAAWALLSSFFGALMAGSLLAGAFDPRALDAEDLGGLGLVVLGCVPALPLGRAARESRGEG
jgi:hypothetical protein